MSLVTLDREDGIAIVTLNRPEAMNALSKALRAELADVMVSVDADDTIRAVVLTGAGERAFTAGLDLKELGSDTSHLGAANDQAPESNPVRAIEQCSKPVIGAINGVAITGGFGVARDWGVLLGSPKTHFAGTPPRGARGISGRDGLSCPPEKRGE